MSRTDAPRTILFLDHTARWSGGEVALLRLLSALDRMRFVPLVVLAEDGPLAERLRALSIETHILPLSPNIREVRKDTLGFTGLARQVGSVSTLLNYARSVERLIHGRGVSLIHCNSLKSDVYGAFVGRFARVPVLWHVRDHIDPVYLPDPAAKAFRAMAQTFPAFVATNSQSTMDRLFPGGVSGRMAHRTRVIHDGLSENEFATAPPVAFKEWPKRPLTVGMVGRIARWKGQHIFLKAAAHLIQHNGAGNARFFVVGSPLFGEESYEKEVRELAASLGERASIIGFREDIPVVLKELDLFVHASVTPEPFGQVVIEAMAAGLPVIASDGGGVREIIQQDENGLLVPLGDIEALAYVMGELIADPARASRLARAGYDRVREAFTAEQTARAVETVYEEIERTYANRNRT